MYDFQKQCETVFLSMVRLSSFSQKQAIIMQLFGSALLICGKYMESVSVIMTSLGR